MAEVAQDPRESGPLSCIARPPECTPGQETGRVDFEGTPVPRVNLNDLPNEILLHILGELQDDELCSLALLSRRMNYLALPIYLSRRSFGPRPTDRLVLFDYNSRDVLRALNPALFKASLTRLHYPLDCEKPPDKLGCELRGLRNLITHNLSSLREATINFQNTTPIELSSIILPTSSFGNAASTYGVPAELRSELLALLDVIIASGCKTLRISHCGSQMHAMRNINTSISDAFGGTLCLVKRSYKRYLQPFTSLFGTSSNKVENNDLETFYLHSSMAFHPHLSRWTIEALNNSHITTLSISQQHFTDEDSWALILPCVHVPKLTNLSLDSCWMRLSDLLKFLSRHNGIQRLYLGRSFTLSIPNPPPSNIIMERLIYVSAPTPSLVHFLGPVRYISTPLFSATILLRISHGLHFHLGMLDEPLQSAFFRLKSLKELHLTLSFVSIPTTWIAPPVSTDSASNPNDNSVHSLVTHLEIDVQTYFLPLFPLTTKLPELLTRFPKLRHLRILTMSNNEPLTKLQKNIATRVMMNHCPQLDSVDFAAVEEA